MSRMKQHSSKTAPTVLGTGLLALDVVFSSESFEPIGRWAGGTFGNVMTILSFLGWTAFPVSRLRKDDEAQEIFDDLKRWKVHIDFILQDAKGTTPVIIEYIRRSASGVPSHRFSLRCPVCGKQLPTYRPLTGKDATALFETLPTPKVFFFDRVSRGALDLAKWSAEKGAIVFFEPSANGDAKQLREAIALAHIVKFSNERFGNVPMVRDARDPLLVIETQGSQGLRYRTRLHSKEHGKWQALAPHKLGRFLDAAGAGDWCAAGILEQLGKDGRVGFEKTSKADLRAAMAYGQALAAWNCEFEGARGGMYRHSLKAFRQQIEQIISGEERRRSSSIKPPVNTAEAQHHLCSSCR